RRSKGQQFPKAPNAAEFDGVGTVGPLGLEFAQRLRRMNTIPIVGHVEQTAAARADERRLVHRERGDTIGVEAALKGEVHKEVIPRKKPTGRNPWARVSGAQGQ